MTTLKNAPGSDTCDGEPCNDYDDDFKDATPTEGDREAVLPGPGTATEQGKTNSLEYLFPAFALKLTLGDLELRLLRDADFPAYAELLRHDIFRPEYEEAVFPWVDHDPDERIRSAFAYQWTVRATMGPDSWALPFGVFHRGELIGSQEINAKNFELTRTVGTGSWLTRSAQGKRLGVKMRQAVLEFAFDYLHAGRAESDAVETNLPSIRTSKRVGYKDNGTTMRMHGGKACLFQLMVLDPEDFLRPNEPLEVEGLTPTLIDLLGAG